MKLLGIIIFMFIINYNTFSQGTSVQILVLNYSVTPNRPEKGVAITPLQEGNGGSTNSSGLFEIKLLKLKPGDKLDLLIDKSDYQIFGPNNRIFSINIPSNSETFIIPIKKITDVQNDVASFSKAIEKQVRETMFAMKAATDSLKQASSEEWRIFWAKQIADQDNQIKELSKNKEELAARLALIDVEQASEFAVQALTKFKQGDLKGALDLLTEEKIEENWKNILAQEEKVKLAKTKAIENYMIRARLLTTNFQIAEAFSTYLGAIAKDSSNFENYYEAGKFMMDQFFDGKAMEVLEQALRIAPSPKDSALTFTRLAILLSRNQKMKEAEEYYLKCVSINKQLMKLDSIAHLTQYIASLNSISNYYKEAYRQKEAEQYILESIAYSKKGVAIDPEKYTPIMANYINTLASTYHVFNKKQDAEKYYIEALGIYRKLARQNPSEYEPLLAVILYNIGLLYFDINYLSKEVEIYLSESLLICKALCEKNPDAYTPDMAKVLNSLGGYYFYGGKTTEAEKYYQEALAQYRTLAKKNPDIFMPEFAFVLNGIGNYYSAVGKNNEAESSFLEGLEIYRQFVKTNPDTYTRFLGINLNNLGTFYFSSHQLDKAFTSYLEAYKVYKTLAEKNPSTFNGDLALTCGNVAWFYLLNKKYTDAQKIAEEGLKIDESQSWIQTSLAHSLLLQNEYSKAKEMYLALKDEQYDHEGNTYGQIMLKELEDLEKEGAKHSGIGKIKKLLVKKEN